MEGKLTGCVIKGKKFKIINEPIELKCENELIQIEIVFDKEKITLYGLQSEIDKLEKYSKESK